MCQIQQPEGIFVREQLPAVIQIQVKQIFHFADPVEKGAFMDVKLLRGAYSIAVFVQECTQRMRIVRMMRIVIF